MIEDGVNVKLTAEMRKKLYMTSDDTATAFLDQSTVTDDDEKNEARKKSDPTYGMTPAQRERYKKK